MDRQEQDLKLQRIKYIGMVSPIVVQQYLEELYKSGEDPETFFTNKGCIQTYTLPFEELLPPILEQNPNADLKTLVGIAMKKSGGKYNPSKVAEWFKNKMLP